MYNGIQLLRTKASSRNVTLYIPVSCPFFLTGVKYT